MNKTTELSNLPCFKHIETISPIYEGYSSHCFTIYADNKKYFVKNISSAQEVNASKIAAQQQISPRVVYHDPSWLVTEFIEGKSLALSEGSIEHKTLIAIQLMAQYHQTKNQSIPLEPNNIANELINNLNLSEMQKREFLQVAKQLSAPLVHCENLVCCHGDINFGNIIISQEGKPYLIDFDSVCKAPAEYDLAMFIAVNNLSKNDVPRVIECYRRNIHHNIDQSRLCNYLPFSYLINGLWYLHAYNCTNNLQLKTLAKQQLNNIPTLTTL